MKILLLIQLALIAPFLCSSQQEPRGQNKQGDVLVKISPLSLLDFRMPNLEFGASIFLTDDFVVQIKIGKEFNHMSHDEKYGAEGFKLTLEYQYYLKSWFYLSIENGLIKNIYSGEMDYRISEMDSTIISDSFYAVEERLYGAFKAGSMFFFGERWRIELYGGIGMQYYRRKINDLEFDKELGHYDPNPHIHAYWGIYHEEIDELRGKLSLGVNICFKI